MNLSRSARRRALGVALSLALTACANEITPPDSDDMRQAAGDDAAAKNVTYWLTLLHNNDGESELLDASQGDADFGGVARFVTLVRELREDAERRRPSCEPEGSGEVQCGGTIVVSSGDNFLAGPELNASLTRGVPFFDALALDRVGYDALALGNHEFDFGPDVLADFIESFAPASPAWPRSRPRTGSNVPGPSPGAARPSASSGPRLPPCRSSRARATSLRMRWRRRSSKRWIA